MVQYAHRFSMFVLRQAFWIKKEEPPMHSDYGVELKKHRKIILKFQKKSSVCAKLARALSSSSLAPVVL